MGVFFNAFNAAFVMMAATAAALVAFPIVYWIQDRRRRGLPTSATGVAGVAILGLLTVGMIVLFMWWRP
jgi:ABC-type Fe3+-siderophore transport system permease subunit